MNDEISKVIAEIELNKKHFTQIHNQLKKIVKFDSNREENIKELTSSLNKLNNIVQKQDLDTQVGLLLSNWIDKYQKQLTDIKDSVQNKFGIELEANLKDINISLSGQYPDLTAGLYTFTLDLDKQEVIIWFGPKQERLGKCPLSATKVKCFIENCMKNMGSNINEEEFIRILHDTCCLISDKYKNGRIPIMKVLPLLSVNLQSNKFKLDPKKDNYRSYSRSDYSFDLYRIRQYSKMQIMNKELHLTVAIKSYTNKQYESLWIPDNITGRGTRYSHLEFRG